MTQYNGEEIDLVHSNGHLSVQSTNLSKSYTVGLYVKPADTAGRWMPQYRMVYSGRDPQSAKRAISDLRSRGVKFVGYTLNDGQAFAGMPKELQ